MKKDHILTMTLTLDFPRTISLKYAQKMCSQFQQS